MSGIPSDFTASQKVTGVGPAYNGSDADNFFFTWGPSELYFGFQQADLGAAYLREGSLPDAVSALQRAVTPKGLRGVTREADPASPPPITVPGI